MTPGMREETDSLGKIELAVDRLYGSNTVRALDNFPSQTLRLGEEKEFVRALAEIKKSCVLANHALGLIKGDIADALILACDEMVDGQLDEHLVVPILEGSGGTSTNMNVNEVLANRALIELGYEVGRYDILHPNDQVNCGQSTNDVIPSAMKIAAYRLSGKLVDGLETLATSLQHKLRQFAEVYRLGRTCLQDGQPMTLGQAFEGYAGVIQRASERIARQQQTLLSIPLGGTAIGTGLGSAPGFSAAVFGHLQEVTGLAVKPASNRFDGMQNLDEFQRLSAEMETATAAMAKIAKDLILLSSGPAGGLAEIFLPAVQPGSSIMPGKVNPVIPMSVVQLSMLVHGNHSCIAMACQDGMLEINHYEPVLASRLFDSLRRSTEISIAFSQHCIDGIEANETRSMENLQNSFALATTLVPRLGYTTVSQLVKDSLKSDASFLELAQQREYIAADEVVELIKSVIYVD
jgi:aspartate ammonia-lyase